MLSIRSFVKVCPCNPSLNLWTNSKDSFGTQKNFSCPFSPQHDRLFFLLKEEELRSLFTLLFISLRYLKSFPSLLNSLNYYLLCINIVIICFNTSCVDFNKFKSRSTSPLKYSNSKRAVLSDCLFKNNSSIVFSVCYHIILKL